MLSFLFLLYFVVFLWFLIAGDDGDGVANQPTERNGKREREGEKGKEMISQAEVKAEASPGHIVLNMTKRRAAWIVYRARRERDEESYFHRIGFCLPTLAADE